MLSAIDLEHKWCPVDGSLGRATPCVCDAGDRLGGDGKRPVGSSESSLELILIGPLNA